MTLKIEMFASTAILRKMFAFLPPAGSYWQQLHACTYEFWRPYFGVLGEKSKNNMSAVDSPWKQADVGAPQRYSQVDKYEAMDFGQSSGLFEKVKDIQEKYIKQGSNFEININSKMRDDVMKVWLIAMSSTRQLYDTVMCDTHMEGSRGSQSDQKFSTYQQGEIRRPFTDNHGSDWSTGESASDYFSMFLTHLRLGSRTVPHTIMSRLKVILGFGGGGTGDDSFWSDRNVFDVFCKIW